MNYGEQGAYMELEVWFLMVTTMTALLKLLAFKNCAVLLISIISISVYHTS
jgi:hypothetical protein